MTGCHFYTQLYEQGPVLHSRDRITIKPMSRGQRDLLNGDKDIFFLRLSSHDVHELNSCKDCLKLPADLIHQIKPISM